MGLLPHPVDKPKKTFALSRNIEEYASRATVHGISYIFDKSVPIVDRFLWLVISLGSATLAMVMIYSSFTDWQDNQVIITLKTLAKPIKKLDFPAVTICGGGNHMELVEKVLYNNFRNWNENQEQKGTEETAKKDFARYMEETFQIDNNTTNIMDILDMVAAPNVESSSANIVQKNEKACKDTQNKELNCQGNQKGKISKIRDDQ